MSRTIQFAIEVGDIAKFDCDVIFLKYAQRFYGADAAVVRTMTDAAMDLGRSWPEPGAVKVVDTQGCLLSPIVAFWGVRPLWALEYQDIHNFGFQAIRWISNQGSVKHLAMTMHGPGFGLDEIEAARAQLAGCKLGLETFAIAALARITWVEINEVRAERVRAALNTELITIEVPASAASQVSVRREAEVRDPISNTRSPSNVFKQKPHIFVAMPFAREFEDVYYFGIQDPVHGVGFLCERIDQEAFTGDVLERVKMKIETAMIVIGELTGNNANVYLEIGYAWGKGRPTILLTREDPSFDVRGQRILRYNTIRELNEKLSRELRTLTGAQD